MSYVPSSDVEVLGAGQAPEEGTLPCPVCGELWDAGPERSTWKPLGHRHCWRCGYDPNLMSSVPTQPAGTVMTPQHFQAMLDQAVAKAIGEKSGS